MLNKVNILSLSKKQILFYLRISNICTTFVLSKYSTDGKTNRHRNIL